MEDLEKKYQEDRISREELQRLRKQLSEEKNTDTEQRLLNKWMNAEPSEQRGAVCDVTLVEVKKGIDRNIGRNRMVFSSLMRRLFRWAAAVLLPVLLFSTAWLYFQNQSLRADKVFVWTKRGERATVSLPDGTEVLLNEESSVHYRVADFTGNKRRVTFDGEAYFSVKQNADKPFFIVAEHLEVEVVGTKFNFRSRIGEQTAEVVLDEGKVNLISLSSQKRLSLNPGHKATLHYATGDFSVEQEAYLHSSAWKNHLLVFRNSPMKDVIRTLEKTYGVTILIDESISPEDPFTGTLTSCNLHESLSIVSASYHLRIHYDNRIIHLKK